MELTSGGVFDAALPNSSQQDDGQIVLEFSNCNQANLSFDITSAGLEGNIPIQRIAPDNIAACEAAQ